MFWRWCVGVGLLLASCYSSYGFRMLIEMWPSRMVPSSSCVHSKGWSNVTSRLVAGVLGDVSAFWNKAFGTAPISPESTGYPFFWLSRK